MKCYANKGAWAICIPTVFNRINLFLSLICFFSLSLPAQKSVNIEVYGLDAKVTKPHLGPGEEAELILQLGAQGPLVEHASGFDIKLQLDPQLAVVSKSDLDDHASWLLADYPGKVLLEQKILSNEVSLSAHIEGMRSGRGELLRIKIKNEGPTLSTEKLLKSGIGIIVIEDIGFRTQAPDPVREPLLFFPNPCQDRLNFEFGAGSPRSIELIDAQGRVVHRFLPMAGTAFQCDLGDLPRGIYQVVCDFEDELRAVKPLWLK